MEKIQVKEAPIEEVVKVNAEIIEFEEPGWPHPKGYFENRYKDKDKLIVVAYASDKPAGYLVSYDKFGDGSFYLWMAGVDPKYRRKGILKTMIEYSEKWAKRKGYKKIKIKTRNNRREMLAYLVKYGFSFTGVEPKPDIKDNRILAEKEL